MIARSSIATRLVVFAVALVGVTALLIGTLSYSRARRALETTAQTRLDLLARDVASHVRRELDERAADITNWAHLEVMRALIYQDVDKELVHFLEQMLRGRPAYEGIACFDEAGRVVAAAGDVAGIEAHTRASRPSLSIVARAHPVLQFETAVFNPERPSDVIGTLIALVDPRPMFEAFDLSAQGATKDVSLSLGDQTGRIVVEADAPGAPGRRRADGTPRSPGLSATAPIGELPDIDAPDLRIAVSQPIRVAFADVTSLRSTLLQTGLLVVLLGAILAAILAWRMALPIRRLTATVREVAAKGEPAAQASFPETGGEVGVLTSAFRSMLESLAAAQQEALLKSRLAFLGEIAANVAHEVRSPLSALKTIAQLLARGGMPAEEQRELATAAAAEVDRLNAVVTGLVDLARPQRVRYRVEAIDAIVDRAIAFLRPLAARSGVEIARVASGDRLLVGCNADQLHQVLLNLLQNAIQATRDQGTVTVTTRRVTGRVQVEVDDTGAGFAIDVLPRVFAPFVTTKPDGTGLGLAIVKRMIEEHGGTVGAENRSTGGARVWVRLPLKEDVT